jgi:predicted outer membrane protein
MIVRLLGIFLISASLLGGALAPAALAKGPNPTGVVTVTDRAPGIPDGGDQQIVTELHLANQLAIGLSELGRERANNTDVSELADTVAADRRAADVALIAYAQVKNMNMDTVGVPGSNLPAHGGLATADLAKLPPYEFDRAFVAKIVANQQGAVDVAVAAWGIARDPDLRSLIDLTLPTLRDQVATAQALDARLPRLPPPPLAPVPAPAPPQ